MFSSCLHASISTPRFGLAFLLDVLASLGDLHAETEESCNAVPAVSEEVLWERTQLLEDEAVVLDVLVPVLSGPFLADSLSQPTNVAAGLEG
jgi:hypothetical protein